MRCQCWQRPAAVRRNRSSRVCGRQMDHSFARDDSACVPQAGQGFAVHRWHMCAHLSMRYYQREPWNVAFELSPCSAPGKCIQMPNAWIRVQGCGERCVRSESFVPWSVADRVSGELCALGVDSESLGVGRASTTANRTAVTLSIMLTHGYIIGVASCVWAHGRCV